MLIKDMENYIEKFCKMNDVPYHPERIESNIKDGFKVKLDNGFKSYFLLKFDNVGIINSVRFYTSDQKSIKLVTTL